MKRITLSRSPRLLFTVIAVLALAVQVFYLFIQLPLSEAPSLSYRVITSLTDALVIFLPFILLRGRWLWLTLVPFLLLPLLVLANVLYLRNFGDILAPVLYFSASPFDGIILRSAFASLSPADSIPLLASAVGIGALIALRRRIASPSPRFIKAYVLSTLAAFVIVVTMVYRRYGNWEGNHSPKTIYVCLFVDEPRTWKPYFYHQGLLWYGSKCVAAAFKSPGTLSDTERTEISDYLRTKASVHAAEPDTLVRPTNLVYVIVESWSARLFDTPEGRMAMPNILKLIDDSASIFIPDLLLQAGVGRSADGQFIYNTGLLPLRSEPYAFTYAFKPYPSLARLFGGNSAEVIGEDANIWSHKATNSAFGFAQLIDNCARGDDELGDSLIFETAAHVAESMAEPFYLEVTTLSMHDPYEEKVVPDELPADITDKLDFRDSNYLARVRFFDRQLARFLEHLRRAGLYDRTLVVIASDHEVRDICITPYLRTNDVPALILNAPRTDVPDGHYRQVDLFPTILDLMGLEPEAFGVPYRGVGESIFSSPGIPRDSLMEREFEISELIIKNK